DPCQPAYRGDINANVAEPRPASAPRFGAARLDSDPGTPRRAWRKLCNWRLGLGGGGARLLIEVRAIRRHPIPRRHPENCAIAATTTGQYITIDASACGDTWRPVGAAAETFSRLSKRASRKIPRRYRPGSRGCETARTHAGRRVAPSRTFCQKF